MHQPVHAVIDLGTNTFHLLIARVDATRRTITEVYRERIFVKLAAEGIETIGPAPFARGIQALKHYREKIVEYGADTVVAIGTAALRTATNGEVFVRTAELEAGIGIRLIDGDTEAGYITDGVMASLPALSERIMIIDIGGGSTEIILASPEGVHWRRSFPFGSMVLSRGFHHGDPITEAEIGEMQMFFDRELQPLRAALAEYPTHRLVGAAGAFEALAGLIHGDLSTDVYSHDLPPRDLERVHFRLIASTLAERLSMPDLPDQRADLIVVASLLVRYVVDAADIRQVTMSEYALKEGVLLSLEE